jgi:hypothetical protein
MIKDCGKCLTGIPVDMAIVLLTFSKFIPSLCKFRIFIGQYLKVGFD